MAVKHEPPMPEEFKENAKRRVGRIKAALGNDGIVGCWSPHGPFNNASLLVDHEELYTLFLTDFEFYERLMRFAMNRILDYARAMDEAGVDVQCVGGNVPGGFLGKRTYDRYILPFEREYINFLQQNGTPAMYHNCGQIMNLVESYVDLGVRVVEPFSPPPLGDADLAKAKALVDGRYVILSGIDQVNVLQNGSVGPGAAGDRADDPGRQARRRLHPPARRFPRIRHAAGERRGVRGRRPGARGLLSGKVVRTQCSPHTPCAGPRQSSPHTPCADRPAHGVCRLRCTLHVVD